MPAPTRSLTIKNLVPSLPERGHIKIGKKGEVRQSKGGTEFQLPVKLDHFEITTMERGPDNNFVRDTELEAAILKQTGQQKLTRIPVSLLYDDIELNFQSRYACYVGRQLWCAGDGQEADRLRQKNSGEDAPPEYERVKVACPCERISRDFVGKNPCKFNGNLSVIIERANVVGGVWKFRTTAYNSVVNLTSQLVLYKGMTGGALAGVPLDLVMGPKATTDKDGKQQTVYVVGLEYRGSFEQLAEAGYQVALRRATSQQRIARVEQEARRLLLGKPTDSVFPGEQAAEIADEFYPDTVAGQNGTIEHVDPVTGEVTTTPARPPRKLDALPSRPLGPAQQQVQQVQRQDPPDGIEELTGRRTDPNIGQPQASGQAPAEQGGDDWAARVEAKLAACSTKAALRACWFDDVDVLAFKQASPGQAGALYDRHWKRVGNGNGEKL